MVVGWLAASLVMLQLWIQIQAPARVESHHRVNSPDTGSNSKGRQTKKESRPILHPLNWVYHIRQHMWHNNTASPSFYNLLITHQTFVGLWIIFLLHILMKHCSFCTLRREKISSSMFWQSCIVIHSRLSRLCTARGYVTRSKSRKNNKKCAWNFQVDNS